MIPSANTHSKVLHIYSTKHLFCVYFSVDNVNNIVYNCCFKQFCLWICVKNIINKIYDIC